MREIIRSVIDKNAISEDFHEDIVDELAYRLTEAGYVRIDKIKIDPECMALCVAKALDEMAASAPLMIEG